MVLVLVLCQGLTGDTFQFIFVPFLYFVLNPHSSLLKGRTLLLLLLLLFFDALEQKVKMKRILSVWHLGESVAGGGETKRQRETVEGGEGGGDGWGGGGSCGVWLYRLVEVAALVVGCRRVRGRGQGGRLVLRFDALGVRLFGGQLVPVLSLGGEGGGGGRVGRQQVEGARHYWS